MSMRCHRPLWDIFQSDKKFGVFIDEWLMLKYTKSIFIMSWIQTTYTKHLLVNSTILLSVYHSYNLPTWPSSLVDAADEHSLFNRDGVQMDHWTPRWDQQRWNTVRPQWSPQLQIPKAAVSLKPLLHYQPLQTSTSGQTSKCTLKTFVCGHLC